MLTGSASRDTRCYGTGVLLRLIAPIAPAFAEECWEILHMDAVYGTLSGRYLKGRRIAKLDIHFPEGLEARRQLADAHGGSIFRQRYPWYPIRVDIVPPSGSHARRCGVLESGALRFGVVIAISVRGLY